MGANRGDSRTTMQRNRAARQETLREYIASQRHDQQALEAVKKMADAADAFELSKWEKVCAAHMRFLDKYLPTTKEMTLDAELAGGLDIRRVNVRGVGTGSKDA